MARQHKNYKRILELEELLYKIQGLPNKQVERKVIFAELEKLSDEIKKRKVIL